MSGCVYSTAELFRGLMKDGCEWHGDIISKKWAESLFFNPAIAKRVADTAARHGEEGVHWKLKDGEILIA